MSVRKLESQLSSLGNQRQSEVHQLKQTIETVRQELRNQSDEFDKEKATLHDKFNQVSFHDPTADTF